ncbi:MULTISPECIES: SDR family oxidoreductase [unclassified Mesorhizobium]|uniref:SDR family NAD(P)-dependent oxidoreductase n=1 Tax=unclassified Mesorhizobium TaxID=325217 RepID=UPI00112E72A8|nr:MULTISPECIES: SDR family oxidoreductase [unclassified Mesorhizobium]TPK65871.1 SDR family oxidoreductase [Mesorhizobium sp. B2-5-1]TPM57956.1 SDR family oxidoreductase [Mesorhizobium sp. B2-1-9]TPM85091.1 SDR family oxidoreductase [Mesorhizobium sp. B2-1-4]TPN10662.1 SDR family oxidoreductase [Mesorhizobium sp. B2-1-2]UCI15139.1 SDR family oxidoreductase [Mesorhizobium sp. B2-1-1]
MTATLTGKVALVTGATGGIGARIVSRLAAEGASVVIGYNRSRQTADDLVSSLAYGDHFVAEATVTDSDCLARLAGQIEKSFGRLDVLVNCAGTTRFVPHPDLDSLDDELIDRIFSVNVRGVIAATRAMRPLLDRTGSGVVVNISSIAGVTAMGSNIAYCASKAAVDNLTKSLARALAPRIRVVSVSPGVVDTDFIKGRDESWRDEQASRTPLGRLGTPDDVAEAVLAAATHLRFVTGVIIPVDGGRPLA